MVQLSKFSKLSFIFLIVLTSMLLAQDNSMHMKDTKASKESADSSLIRKGKIDLKSIDKNNDCKIFQCPMEVNVLSDSKGECPLCGMNLREISISDANAKLLKRGFEVKETIVTEKSQTVIKNDDAKSVIWNKVCPVMGEEVDPEAPTKIYKGKVIGFCCKGCEKKFLKDPEKYMKNLNGDGTEFIGKK